MKKLLILALLLSIHSILLLSTGCGLQNKPQPDVSKPAVSPTATLKPIIFKTVAPIKELWKTLPRIDGSTATIPLS